MLATLLTSTLPLQRASIGIGNAGMNAPHPAMGFVQFTQLHKIQQYVEYIVL